MNVDLTPEIVRLGNILRAAAQVHKIDADELLGVVYAAVDRLKAAGWSIEGIIVFMKRRADDAGIAPLSHPALQTSHPSVSEVVRTNLIRWCIERYYAEPDR
jgi:hypothetical protein